MKKIIILLIASLYLLINHANAQSFTNYTTATTSTTIPYHYVDAIAIDPDSNIWIATSEWQNGSSLSKFNGTSWTTYTASDGLVNGLISVIAIDAQGNKWIGTDAGVSEFDGSTWMTYTSENGLAYNDVTAMAIDIQDNKWFATWGNGVSKFDGTTWRTYTVDDGLVDNNVAAIATDAQGNKWFGTYSGVSKLSAEGNVGTETLTNINPLDLYPNPVQNIFHINFPGKKGTLEVFDNSGKSVLLKEIGDNNSTVDVSGLVDGIYSVKVLSDNKLYTGKIVKQ